MRCVATYNIVYSLRSIEYAERTTTNSSRMSDYYCTFVDTIAAITPDRVHILNMNYIRMLVDRSMRVLAQCAHKHTERMRASNTDCSTIRTRSSCENAIKLQRHQQQRHTHTTLTELHVYFLPYSLVAAGSTFSQTMWRIYLCTIYTEIGVLCCPVLCRVAGVAFALVSSSSSFVNMQTYSRLPGWILRPA